MISLGRIRTKLTLQLVQKMYEAYSFFSNNKPQNKIHFYEIFNTFVVIAAMTCTA